MTTTPQVEFLLLPIFLSQELQQSTAEGAIMVFSWIRALLVLLATPATEGFCFYSPKIMIHRTSAAIGMARSHYEPPLPNFCAECGAAAMKLQIPPGDDHVRAVCQECNAVVYSNPKVVVACVVQQVIPSDGSSNTTTTGILMGKRSIEPRSGYWGIPQGYMEHGETTREAAIREVYEETGFQIEDPQQLQLCGLFNVPGSVQLVYKVDFLANDPKLARLPSNTTENSEIELVDPSIIGSSSHELCFPTVRWAIDHVLSRSERVQQKNKLYNAITKEWSESEDF